MGRKGRQRKKTFVIFCEGKTEYNYFGAIKSVNLDIVLKPVNMGGGGYKSFLEVVKKNSNVNRLATFIIVDGDRAQNIPGELAALKELQNYCEQQNRRDNESPYFLIVNSPDFEYIACLHDPAYSEGDTTRHIEKFFKFKNLDDFKKNTEIYKLLNSVSRSYQQMITKLKSRRPRMISTQFERKNILIIFQDTAVDWSLINDKNSNIEEFYNIVTGD